MMRLSITRNSGQFNNFSSLQRIINTIGIPFLLSFFSSVALLYSQKELAIIFSAIYLLYIAFKPTNSYLLYIVFAIPNLRALGLFSISVSSLICVIYLLKKFNKVLKNKTVLLFSLMFFMFCLQYIIRYSDFQSGLFQPLKIIIVLAFVCVYSKEDLFKEGKGVFAFNIATVWLTGVLASIIPMFLLRGFDFRLSAVENDSNILAVELVFIYSLFFVSYYLSKNKTILSYLIAFSLCFVLIIACGSRTGLVLFLITSIAIPILGINSQTAFKTFVILLLLILVFFAISRLEIIKGYVDILARRINSMERAGDTSNGRLSLWNNYLSLLKQRNIYWLFGVGSYKVFGMTKIAHNMVLEDIVSYGLIGTTILFIMYLATFNTVKKAILIKKTKWFKVVAFVPFIIPVLGGITLHTLTGLPNTIMLFVGFSLFCLPTNNSSKDVYNEK